MPKEFTVSLDVSQMLPGLLRSMARVIDRMAENAEDSEASPAEMAKRFRALACECREAAGSSDAMRAWLDGSQRVMDDGPDARGLITRAG